VWIYVSALIYPTVNYVLAKFEGREIAKAKIGKFKLIAEMSDLTYKIIDKGLLSDFTDFEGKISKNPASPF
jgi:hypothetical protein